MASEAPVNLQSRRRRWKRWAVVGLLPLIGLAWLFLAQPPEIEGTRAVRLGQAQEEVRAHVSQWFHVQYSNDDGTSGFLIDSRRKPVQFVLVRIRHWTGWRLPPELLYWGTFDDWPVHIRFDKKHRVDRIKRGSEIIEAPTASRVK
jgi:hypothetical protein